MYLTRDAESSIVASAARTSSLHSRAKERISSMHYLSAAGGARNGSVNGTESGLVECVAGVITKKTNVPSLVIE